MIPRALIKHFDSSLSPIESAGALKSVAELFPNLETLRLQETRPDHPHLAYPVLLAKYPPTLTSLSLVKVSADIGWEAIPSSVTHLTALHGSPTLNADRDATITFTAFFNLPTQLPNLKLLAVYLPHFTLHDPPTITFPNLETLNLREMKHERPQSSFDPLRYIMAPKLTSLELATNAHSLAFSPNFSPTLTSFTFTSNTYISESNVLLPVSVLDALPQSLLTFHLYGHFDMPGDNILAHLPSTLEELVMPSTLMMDWNTLPAGLKRLAVGNPRHAEMSKFPSEQHFTTLKAAADNAPKPLTSPLPRGLTLLLSSIPVIGPSEIGFLPPTLHKLVIHSSHQWSIPDLKLLLLRLPLAYFIAVRAPVALPNPSDFFASSTHSCSIDRTISSLSSSTPSSSSSFSTSFNLREYAEFVKKSSFSSADASRIIFTWVPSHESDFIIPPTVQSLEAGSIFSYGALIDYTHFNPDTFLQNQLPSLPNLTSLSISAENHVTLRRSPINLANLLLNIPLLETLQLSNAIAPFDFALLPRTLRSLSINIVAEKPEFRLRDGVDVRRGRPPVPVGRQVPPSEGTSSVARAATSSVSLASKPSSSTFPPVTVFGAAAPSATFGALSTAPSTTFGNSTSSFGTNPSFGTSTKSPGPSAASHFGTSSSPSSSSFGAASTSPATNFTFSAAPAPSVRTSPFGAAPTTIAPSEEQSAFCNPKSLPSSLTRCHLLGVHYSPATIYDWPLGLENLSFVLDASWTDLHAFQLKKRLNSIKEILLRGTVSATGALGTMGTIETNSQNSDVHHASSSSPASSFTSSNLLGVYSRESLVKSVENVLKPVSFQKIKLDTSALLHVPSSTTSIDFIGSPNSNPEQMPIFELPSSWPSSVISLSLELSNHYICFNTPSPSNPPMTARGDILGVNAVQLCFPPYLTALYLSLNQSAPPTAVVDCSVFALFPRTLKYLRLAIEKNGKVFGSTVVKKHCLASEEDIAALPRGLEAIHYPLLTFLPEHAEKLPENIQQLSFAGGSAWTDVAILRLATRLATSFASSNSPVFTDPTLAIFKTQPGSVSPFERVMCLPSASPETLVTELSSTTLPPVFVDAIIGSFSGRLVKTLKESPTTHWGPENLLHQTQIALLESGAYSNCWAIDEQRIEFPDPDQIKIIDFSGFSFSTQQCCFRHVFLQLTDLPLMTSLEVLSFRTTAQISLSQLSHILPKSLLHLRVWAEEIKISTFCWASLPRGLLSITLIARSEGDIEHIGGLPPNLIALNCPNSNLTADLYTLPISIQYLWQKSPFISNHLEKCRQQGRDVSSINTTLEPSSFPYWPILPPLKPDFF